MRVLMTCRPSYGHYTPMVGLAIAFLCAGHGVTFATAAPPDQAIRRDAFDVENEIALMAAPDAVVGVLANVAGKA
jgi:hypothetical protein